MHMFVWLYVQVLQTLCEAEQVCDELRLSVSGLDSRLAELLHWETEARELYQVLKEETHKRKRGQDPTVKVSICFSMLFNFYLLK